MISMTRPFGCLPVGTQTGVGCTPTKTLLYRVLVEPSLQFHLSVDTLLQFLFVYSCSLVHDMVIWSYSESKSIPTFKLHRVIIPIWALNVKFLIHFFSFFLTLIHCFALSGMALAYISGYFGGPGHKDLGAGLGLFGGWDGKKDFCGRVR